MVERAVAHHLISGPPPGAPAGSRPQPLWPAGSSRFGARFTPKGGHPSVYLASDPHTALKEVNAIFQIPNGPIVAIPASPYTLVQVNVMLVDNVLDLCDPTICVLLSTSTQELTGDWRYMMGTGGVPPTHRLAIAAHASNRISAIVAHSSKHVGGGKTLAVFANRLTAGNSIEVFDQTGLLNQRLP